MVRPTSEDVVTENIWSTLEMLEPRYWVSDLLNAAVGSHRFRRQWYRRFEIVLWEKQADPSGTVPWREGRTEVDVVLRWENPPTTVFVEMKYASSLATTVSNQPRNGQAKNGHKYPSDQLIRNARVGLRECGWFNDDLFGAKRDFCLIYCSPTGKAALVDSYRDIDQLLDGTPQSQQITELPVQPFVGAMSYRQIADTLTRQKIRYGRRDQRRIERLETYLDLKISQLSRTG